MLPMDFFTRSQIDVFNDAINYCCSHNFIYVPLLTFLFWLKIMSIISFPTIRRVVGLCVALK